MRNLLLLTVLLTSACDPFAAAQKADSVEAYEAFLTENPNSAWRPQAADRLQVLLFEAAQEENTLPAYDAWLTRFPSSSMRDDVMSARSGSLYTWARETDTVESWQAFLAEYPESRRRPNAERGERAARYRPQLTVGEPRSSRTNLAEDPEGPMNGWLIEADVTNIGENAFKTVILHPTSPSELSTLEWPVAAPRWTLPLTDEQKRPLRPGETRTWSWTTDDLDESWDGNFQIVVSDAAQ